MMNTKRTHVLGVLFFTLLLDMIGIGMLIPIIPSLFTDPTSPSYILEGYSANAAYIVAGLVTALFGFMQFLAAPFLGELSDVYGRKRLLALGVGTLALANLVFAAGIEIASLGVLLFSRMIAGVAGANFSIAQAAIADVTPPEDRARAFGMIGAAFGLGFILGPLLGGWIAGASGDPAVPFIFAGALGVINVLMLSFLFPETRRGDRRTGSITIMKAFHNIGAAWRDVDVRPAYAVGFLSMLGFTLFTSFIPVFLVDRFGLTETQTGIYFAIVGGWIIFAQLVVVRFASGRYSERQILSVALPMLAASIIVHPFVSEIAFLYAVMPFMASAVGLITTSVPALVSKGVSPDQQGAALGINGSLQALTGGIAPLIAGAISSFLGLNAAFIAGALITGLSVLILRPAKRRIS